MKKIEKNPYAGKIPIEFYNDNHGPVRVDTVGELIEQLKKLPKDLQVGDDGFGAEICVYNYGYENTHLEIEFNW